MNAKPQDILFFIILLFFIWKKNPRYLVLAGLTCLALSMPLFQLQVFFTAQRLVYYATALLFISTCLYIFEKE